MAYLFDTDAVVELLKPKPDREFLAWLRTIPRAEQFTTAITVAELSSAAWRSADRSRQLSNIETVLLCCVTVLPFDAAAALVYGGLEASGAGADLEEAELQIVSIALLHDLELVTADPAPFNAIGGLRFRSVPRVTFTSVSAGPSRRSV
jgi:predicted nucleic acid-binding protein